MEPHEIAKIAIDVAGLLFIPVYIFMVTRREKRFDHLDQCIDELKVKVMSGMASMSDLDRLRQEIRADFVQFREEVNRADHGIHNRIMRLESLEFTRGRKEP